MQKSHQGPYKNGQVLKEMRVVEPPKFSKTLTFIPSSILWRVLYVCNSSKYSFLIEQGICVIWQHKNLCWFSRPGGQHFKLVYFRCVQLLVLKMGHIVFVLRYLVIFVILFSHHISTPPDIQYFERHFMNGVGRRELLKDGPSGT